MLIVLSIIYNIIMINIINRILKKENYNNNKDNDISNNFQLPIHYIESKYLLQENIKYDLEINDHENSIYSYLFNSKNRYSKHVQQLWSKYYTTDIKFLMDTQYFLKEFKVIKCTRNNNYDINDIYENNDNNDINDINDIYDTDSVYNIINELRNETGFHEKYKYVDNEYLTFFNKNPLFLQSLTIYNLTSPLLTLAIPIIMLIIPFFFIKFHRRSLNISEYFNALTNVIKYHFIGKSLIEFNSVGWDRRFFIIVSIIFYFINIYQNFISCYTFYKNFFKIKNYLNIINNFLNYSIESISNINKYCKLSYQKFIEKNIEIKNILIEFKENISTINLDNTNINQITKVGIILYNFYELFDNKIYNQAIDYALYLNGYICNIVELQKNLKTKSITFCKFTNKTTNFKKAYFAPLLNNKPVKNNYTLVKNTIITGPNAAGKTTILKTTLFNIIISQQLGLGFYKKAYINPYKYIHSYINIPDTSNRDSLFQAEARRCKEILDLIVTSKNNERHFCIFDEIYSGTNPTEAIASAYSFLLHITNIEKVDLMLTTHYNSLCNMLNSENTIINKQMEILNNNNTYKLINGISNIKGGIKVLEDLNYDYNIIELAKNIINTINI